VGVFLEGYHTDAARTYAVGSADPKAEKLIEVTRECFYKGVEQFKPGNRINDISGAIEDYALLFGYGVVRELTGHGIGRHLHESPDVPNFRTKTSGIRIEPGLVIAIEPMINLGSDQVYVRDDEWTIATKDSSLSAHYENTVALTSEGIVLLTI
jgi:methionyl aminopeptidase